VFAVAKQADGSEVAVFAGKNIVLEPTVRIVVEGQRPLVLLAHGNVQLSGTLQAIPNHIYAEEGNGGGVKINLRLTQTDLAELVGASRERVNQVMVEFRQKGYLSVDSSHHIQVHQPPAPTRLCR
jgi:hypothetical protein